MSTVRRFQFLMIGSNKDTLYQIFQTVILGEKYVQTGSTRNVECDTNRFQPFSLWSNQSSNCIFLKTDCSEEGQVVYGNGSTIYDRTCGCDYSKGYTFFIQPIHQCFCRPIFEDCSCTLKECPIGQILNAGKYLINEEI